jgi:hypothetical protein
MMLYRLFVLRKWRQADMKFTEKSPPRMFSVGKAGQVTLRDCGNVILDSDEQVTFHNPDSGSRFDVTRKSFGYYAANSLNGTLIRQGLRPALCRNQETGLIFLLLVEAGKEEDYHGYLTAEAMIHLFWLDGELPEKLTGKPAR